jgi:hypothetical protein
VTGRVVDDERYPVRLEELEQAPLLRPVEIASPHRPYGRRVVQASRRGDLAHHRRSERQHQLTGPGRQLLREDSRESDVVEAFWPYGNVPGDDSYFVMTVDESLTSMTGRCSSSWSGHACLNTRPVTARKR